MLMDSPASERNKAPILAALEGRLPGRGRVLELACGGGQHAVHFARALPGLEWIPSDPDPECRASTDLRARMAGLANVRPALALDARARPWPERELDAVYTANLLHVSPWEVAQAVFGGAAEALLPGGLLCVYGPFREGGRHTSAGNEAFDRTLRARDPAWGIRDREALEALAREVGLVFRERVPMPANNLLLLFERPRPVSG